MQAISKNFKNVGNLNHCSWAVSMADVYKMFHIHPFILYLLSPHGGMSTILGVKQDSISVL